MSDTLSSGEMDDEKLVDALLQLYRGEIQRVNTWRGRLDRTPHWSIVLTAGMVTWVFSGPERSPALILVALPLVGALMVLEAHRYQRHEVWRSRLRLLEENLFADLLDPDTTLPRKKWRKLLASDLRIPEHKSTLPHAISIRLRRIYLWIFITLLASWGLKISLHPDNADSFRTIMQRSRIGIIPGWVIFGILLGIVILGAVFVIWGRQVEEEEREGEIPEEEPGYEWRREEELDMENED